MTFPTRSPALALALACLLPVHLTSAGLSTAAAETVSARAAVPSGSAASSAAASAATSAAPSTRPPPTAATEAAIQRALELRRIERLREHGKPRDANGLIPLLKDADAQIRQSAEQAIWASWGRSGHADIDRLFRAGVTQIGRNQIAEAIETLTRVIAIAPDFAEAWNKRATARFLIGDLDGALEDCERTLKLVPKHFGSLAGFGHIYFRLDELDQALDYWERALEINPNLEGIARSIDAVRGLQNRRGRLTT